MGKSKINPFAIFIYGTIEFLTLCALGLGTMITARKKHQTAVHIIVLIYLN
jgi:hypothetical protein